MSQRLGKNSGAYFGETIAIGEVLRAIDEAAALTGWERETFFEGTKPLHAYRQRRPSAVTRLYISTGIHGDEPSGPLSIRRLFIENAFPDSIDITLIPCLNPGGFELNRRENEDGIDLNRDYRDPKTPVVRAHIAWLERQAPFDLAVVLHEDWEASGFYVYELNPLRRRSLAEPLLAAVGTVCPIESASVVDTWSAEQGIIRPQIPAEERPQWAESLWLITHKTKMSYTLETPSDYPLPFRVQAHVKAMRTLFELLEQNF